MNWGKFCSAFTLFANEKIHMLIYKIETWWGDDRQMKGEELQGLGIEELQHLEKLLERGLKRVLETKVTTSCCLFSFWNLLGVFFFYLFACWELIFVCCCSGWCSCKWNQCPQKQGNPYPSPVALLKKASFVSKTLISTWTVWFLQEKTKLLNTRHEYIQDIDCFFLSPFCSIFDTVSSHSFPGSSIDGREWATKEACMWILFAFFLLISCLLNLFSVLSLFEYGRWWMFQ